MSYLTLQGDVPSFSQAVISLWFRVPRESVIAASTSLVGSDAFPLLQSVLPLITFGSDQQSKLYITSSQDVAVIHTYIPGEPPSVTTYNALVYTEGASYDIDPSFIGLLCRADGTFDMEFHLQTDTTMLVSAATHSTTQMDIYSGSDPGAPVVELGNGVVGLGLNVGIATIADVSYTATPQNEFFDVTTNISLEPDQWHHLLLSFDIGGSVSIGTPFASSSCLLWYAIDDVDYRGAENLQPYRYTDDTLHQNAILTRTAWAFSGEDPAFEAGLYYENNYVGLPSGSYGGGSIPSGSMGIPATTKYVDGIFRVEMAEFQMWIDVTLDTGIESNRRAFIDEDGKPVDPEGEEDTDNPTGPGETLLGSEPLILLHGNSKWQEGRNTGSLGKEFTPTGGIEKFKPEPALNETSA